MLLKHIEIKNFRCIEGVSVELHKTDLLMGENNTGKTTMLCALDLCMSQALALGENVFQPYDFHLEDENSEPTSAKPIEIKLVFQETEKGEWDENVLNALENARYKNDSGYECVSLNVTGKFDPEAKSFKSEIHFLNKDGNIASPSNKFICLMELQRMVPVYLLSSLRNAGQEFHSGSKFWKPILGKAQFSKETLAEIVANLKDLNSRMLSGNQMVDRITSQLSKLSGILPLGREKTVLVEAVPTKPFDVLSRTQVNLSSVTGAHIPLELHGSGTQSLAVLLLIEAAIRAYAQDATSKPMHSIMALEEPEAHLHSIAEKALVKILPEISGQKIITTHSGKIPSIYGFDSIIVFRFEGRNLVCHQMNREQMEQGMTDREVKKMRRKLDNQVLRHDADWLLARAWFLFEGEVEDIILPQCADSMGLELSNENVAVIKYSRLSLEYLLKLASQFGINWFLLADADKQGRSKVEIAQKYLNGREMENHICLLDHGNMELFLCMNGFGHIYEETVSNQKKHKITLDKSNGLDYWKQVEYYQSRDSKVENATIVADEIDVQGETSVPPLLKRVIKKVVKLSRGIE